MAIDSLFIIIYRGITVLLQLVTYRLLDGLLGSESMGFWLTLMTVSSWMMISDFGIGNGLRNKVAALLARSKHEDAKMYINSVYRFMLNIIGGVLSISIIIALIFAVNEWYGIETISTQYIFSIVCVLLIATAINVYFISNSSISFAIFKPRYKSKVLLLFQLIFVLQLLILKKYVNAEVGSILLLVSMSYLISAVITNAATTYTLFHNNAELKPVISDASYTAFKSVLTIGSQFFIIQIAALLLYSTDTILIAYLFEYSDVTAYKVSSRLFFLFVFIQGALLSPVWSKYTQYASSNDRESIYSTLRRTLQITFVLFGLIVVFYQVGEITVQVWFGHTGYFKKEVFVAMAILVSMMIWSSNFSTLFNGISSFRGQIVTSVIASVINIPLSIVFVRIFGLGMEGVIYGTIASLSLFALYAPLATRKNVAAGCAM